MIIYIYIYVWCLIYVYTEMLWNFLTIILFRPIKGSVLISMALRYTIMINQFSDTIQFAGNGLATDSHCCVYGRGWTTCLLYGETFLFYIPVFRMTRTCRVGASEIILYFVLPFHTFCITQVLLIAFLLKYFLHSENILYSVLCTVVFHICSIDTFLLYC